MIAANIANMKQGDNRFTIDRSIDLSIVKRLSPCFMLAILAAIMPRWDSFKCRRFKFRETTNETRLVLVAKQGVNPGRLQYRDKISRG